MLGVRWYQRSLFAAACCSCHSERPPASSPVVITDKPPPHSAEQLGEVVATAGSGCDARGQAGNASTAVDSLRLEATGLGADYVQLQEVTRSSDPTTCHEVRARGLAFRLLPAKGFRSGNAAGSEVAPTRANQGTARPGCLVGRVERMAKSDPPVPWKQRQVPGSQIVWSCDFELEAATPEQVVPGSPSDASYAMRYRGDFYAPASGNYTFLANSTVPLRIIVDGQRMAEVTLVHAEQAVQREVYWERGRHHISIDFLVLGPEISLNLLARLPGSAQWVPFSTKTTSPFHIQQPLDLWAKMASPDWGKRPTAESQPPASVPVPAAAPPKVSSESSHEAKPKPPLTTRQSSDPTCQSSHATARDMTARLESWATAYRACSHDRDCVAATAVECLGSAACVAVVVNASSADALRVHGARLDALLGYCRGLDEHADSQSCNTCRKATPTCNDGICKESVK